MGLADQANLPTVWRSSPHSENDCSHVDDLQDSRESFQKEIARQIYQKNMQCWEKCTI